MIQPTSAWARVGLRRATNSKTQTFTSPNFAVRRHTHNQSQAQPSNEVASNAAKEAAPKSIPGPSWLWLEPIYTPFRAYGRVQQRSPYKTQLASSLVIYFVGDLCAQAISVDKVETSKDILEEAEGKAVPQLEEEDEKLGFWANRDWARTGRALTIGAISSIPSYKWFVWLSESFNYKSKILSLTTKVVVNQIVFTPIFNSYFFGMQSFLSGATFPEIIERIKNTVPVSVVNSCKIWPAVTAFSFTYIPIQFRSIFGGVIAIGWQTYLSLLNQRAAREEQAAQESEGPLKESAIECQAREKATA